MLRRLSIGIAFLALVALPACNRAVEQPSADGPAAVSQQPPNAGLDGFVPAGSLPPTEQIAAAPLLVGSYAFFLVLMMFYLWTIWRRIGRVEREMQDLERRQGTAKR